MWEFNYGEWTEAYVFLRLLGNGRIYAANADFKRDNNVYIDIINVMRHEKDHILQFERMMENETINAYDNKVLFRVLAYSELTEKADFLYDAIRKVTSNDRKFSVPEIEEFLKELKFSQPKIPQLPHDVAMKFGKKTDIIITLEDSTDHAVSTTGFSVKSHLGSASTLFNAAQASNLIYEIEGCTDAEMNEINGNQIESELGMFKYIKDNPKLSLKFVGTSEEFQANLDFVELTMAEILNCAMLVQVGYYDRATSSNTSSIIDRVAEINPVNVKRPELWYKAKMKDFLFAAFSGLTATEAWDGRKRLSGGYIDVNADGEMLYYRAVSDDIFNTFLYEHTFFDRPSRGVKKNLAKLMATAQLAGYEVTDTEKRLVTYKMGTDGKEKKNPVKGDWGYVYKKDNKYYISINFQLRFK